MAQRVAVRRLGERVLEVLSEGPRSPGQLRAALPGEVLSFGEAGKKLGVTTNLPPALRLLEWDGAIRRRHATGRVDSERYTWEIPDVSPLSLGERPSGEQARIEALARRFFEWAAPATLEEFTGWSKVAKGKANKAIAGLGLAQHELEGETVYGDLAESIDDGLHFLPAQDNLLSLRASPALLVQPEHHDLELIGLGRGLTPLSKARWIFHRVIARAGRIVGFWEWDRDLGDVVLVEIEDVGASPGDLAAFIRDDLDGEARASGVDGVKSQKKRVDWVRTRR